MYSKRWKTLYLNIPLPSRMNPVTLKIKIIWHQPQLLWHQPLHCCCRCAFSEVWTSICKFADIFQCCARVPIETFNLTLRRPCTLVLSHLGDYVSCWDTDIILATDPSSLSRYHTNLLPYWQLLDLSVKIEQHRMSHKIVMRKYSSP